MTARLEWLKQRQTGVGSSDAPCLVGVGFRSAADVYRDKVGPVSDRADDFLDLGMEMEPIVEARYQRVMGTTLLLGSGVRHPDRPWQAATLDRTRLDDGRPVELKTTAGFGDGWGEPGTAEVPPGYWVQVQHQLGVVGGDSADLAALCRISGEFRVYRIPFDLGFFNWLTDVEGVFWLRVTGRMPPGPGWEDQFAARAVSQITPGKAVVLGDDAAALCRRRAELKLVRDDAQDAYEWATEQLEALMGDAEKATAGAYRLKVVTRKAYTRPACDVAAGSYLDVRAVKEMR
jgi:putative phage-type endonuclease